MFKFFLILPFSFLSLFLVADENKRGDFLGAKIIENHPKWFRTSFLELQDDIDELRDNGKHLILYIGQDGCPYCAKLIEDNFTNKELVKKLKQNFEIIAINMWGDREVINLDNRSYTEKEFAAKLKVQFTPTLLFFDTYGKIVLRLNGYQDVKKMSKILDYVANREYNNIKFSQFINKDLASKDATISKLEYSINPPYILTRNSHKPADKYLMLIFEKPNCTECSDFKNNMLNKENIKNLVTQMDVVQLDINDKNKLRVVDGAKINAKNWYKKLDLTYLPAVVIINKKGEEVIRKDAFLKEFHFESILSYALSGSYKTEPNFQRYIEHRADKIRDSGQNVDIWK